VAADWDSGGYDASADTVKIDEARSAAADGAYDIDPDTENYAAGNDPETAYRDQGRPDSPNGWSGYASEDSYETSGHAEGDHAETADEDAEPLETDGATEPPDLWGDTDPDAANYADLDGNAADGPEGLDGPDPDQAAENHNDTADAGQHDQAEPAQADNRRDSSPEQQQITALEAKVADQDQQIADLKAKDDEKTAHFYRIDQQLAALGRQPDGTDATERGDNKPATAADQQQVQDAAVGKHDATMAEHEGTHQVSDADDAGHHGSRRAAWSENFGIASAVAGATDTVTQFAAHTSLEGTLGLGAVALGLASLALGKSDKHAEKKRKGKP
jgi:hypothetical protein